MGDSETKVKQPGALKSFLAGGAGGICLVSRLTALPRFAAVMRLRVVHGCAVDLFCQRPS